MDRERIRRAVRGADPARRQARRSLWPPADVRRRAGDLHPGVGRLRPVGERRPAGRGPRDPGDRRRADEPAFALDSCRNVPAQAAAGRDRRVGRDLRPRSRDRTAARWGSRRERQLVSGVLDQRTDRPGGCRGHAVGGARVLRRHDPLARSPGHDPGHRLAVLRRLGFDQERQPRLRLGVRDRLPGRRARCWRSRSWSGSGTPRIRCCRSSSSRAGRSRCPT